MQYCSLSEKDPYSDLGFVIILEVKLAFSISKDIKINVKKGTFLPIYGASIRIWIRVAGFVRYPESTLRSLEQT
jgi:hypothetical protein